MATTISIDRIDDFIGTTGAPSNWLTVDQDRINAFADATLDHQYIHVDAEKAKQTPFGTTIAHGFLTLSLIPYLSADGGFLIDNTVMGINYGLNKVRFLAPVKVGSSVRSVSKLLSVEPKGPNRFLMTTEVTIEIQGEEKPALIAEMLAMYVLG